MNPTLVPRLLPVLVPALCTTLWAVTANPAQAATGFQSSLLSASCDSLQFHQLQPPQQIAIGREAYTSLFFIESQTKPGFLTCRLGGAPERPTAEQVHLQFGLADNNMATSASRTIVSAYLDGKLWRSVILQPKQKAQVWNIPVGESKSLSLEVTCPAPCRSRVYFTQATLDLPTAAAPAPTTPTATANNTGETTGPAAANAEGAANEVGSQTSSTQEPGQQPNPDSRSNRGAQTLRNVERTLQFLNLVRSVFRIF